ncbi:sensor histidine kinase [Flexivirga alba]|uniref:histidine kinase n=1 Tax=Flexivirga alba TaxID=702742 RepID=A0ABW2ALV4_9MICO
MPQIWEQGRPTRRQLIFDLSCAAAFALLIGIVYAHVGLAQLGVVLVLAGAMAVRRLSLPAMVLLGTAAAVIQFAHPGWSLQLFVADVAYAALFFVLGAHPRAAVRRFGLVAGGVGCACLLVWMTTLVDTGSSTRARVFSAGAVTAMAVLVCGGGWVAGFLRLQRRRSIQSELDRVEQRRLAESYEHELQRSRVAADMHDIVAHSWAVVAAQADGARYALRADPDATEQALEVIAETARSTIADLRTILAELRDNDAEQSTPGYEQAERLMQRMRLTGMRIQERRTGDAAGSSLIALTAYRLLSEALTNALKHGDLGQPVQVEQDWTSGYRLRVVNAVGAPGDGTGHGIIGMMERAAISGGRLESRQVGGEWVVDAAIPDPQRSAADSTQDAKESAST